MELGNLIFGHSRGKVEIPRDWDNKFYEIIDSFNLNYHGQPLHDPYGNDIKINDRGGITTSKFEINPYWWGDMDDHEAERPNFLYYPTGYEIRWYKYPLRDAYANMELTYEQFSEIVKDCIGG